MQKNQLILKYLCTCKLAMWESMVRNARSNVIKMWTKEKITVCREIFRSLEGSNYSFWKEQSLCTSQIIIVHGIDIENRYQAIISFDNHPSFNSLQTWSTPKSYCTWRQQQVSILLETLIWSLLQATHFLFPGVWKQRSSKSQYILFEL